jgi:hypothetical protein
MAALALASLSMPSDRVMREVMRGSQRTIYGTPANVEPNPEQQARKEAGAIGRKAAKAWRRQQRLASIAEPSEARTTSLPDSKESNR